MKKIKEIIEGLEAGKELHHKDWEDNEYSIAVDNEIVDQDGCTELYSDIISEEYADLEGFYLTEPQHCGIIIFVYYNNDDEFMTLKNYTESEFISKYPNLTFVRFAE